jgi:heat shock protein HslJ
MKMPHTRSLLPILVALALAGCAPTDPGPPVLPGYVNAPPPPMPAAGDSLLTGTVWSWQETQMSDGARIVPDAPERYTLEFQPGGRVNIRADCNRGSTNYLLTGGALTFGPIALTRAACPPGSRDAEFLKGLANVSGQLFRGNDLVLTLKVDSGSMRFTTPRQ